MHIKLKPLWSYRHIAIFLLLLTACFFSFYKNSFRIVKNNYLFYQTPSYDEMLVIGRILVDEYNLKKIITVYNLDKIDKHNTNRYVGKEGATKYNLLWPDVPYHLRLSYIFQLPQNILQNNQPIDDITLSPIAYETKWWKKPNIIFNNIFKLSDDKIYLTRIKVKKDKLNFKQHYQYRNQPSETAYRHDYSYSGRTLLIGNYKTMVRQVLYSPASDLAYIHTTIPPDELQKIKKNNSTITLSGNVMEKEILQNNVRFASYISTVGLHGYIFSWLFQHSDKNLETLWKITSLLSALVIVGLTFLYYRSHIFPKGFAISFFASLFLSVIFTAYARDLYWLPFTWFLPSIFAILYIKAENHWHRIIYILLTYLAFTLKNITTGYEITSSVILMAAAPAAYLLLTSQSLNQKIIALKKFFMICFLGVAGFFTSLLILAYIRGDSNIIDGLKSIYDVNITKRIINKSDENIPGYIRDSSISYYEVFKIFFRWNHDWGYPQTLNIIDWLPIKFVHLFFLSFFITLSSWVVPFLQHKKYIYNSLFIIFFLTASSYIILAKYDAYLHIFQNLVLWYFGFIAAMFYIIASGMMTYGKIILAYGKKKIAV
ncbi:MAG: hypothetical protein ACR2NY_00505 [Alphaproteobacteria bacterium]